MNDRYDIETCDCPGHVHLAELARLRDLTRPIQTEGDLRREKIRKSNEA